MSVFNMLRDGSGATTFALPFHQNGLGFSTQLTADTSQSLVVPSNYKSFMAVFSYTPGSSVWVANSATISLPSGTFATTNAQLNPTSRIVNAGDTLSFITSVASAEIGIVFYGI